MSFNLIHRIVSKYDGQGIYLSNNQQIYELGNYLGGGASGSVYQASDITIPINEKQVAIKILNPVGFKLFPNNQINKCEVIRKGLPLTIEQHQGKNVMISDNIWWLYHTASRQILAAYEDPRTGQLKELTLPKCVEVWGFTPFGERDNQLSSDEEEKQNLGSTYYTIDGVTRLVPRVAPKYLKWLRSRQSICREIGSMMQLGEHQNIIKLYEVLELIQDSKTTLFLVLELVTGGEMFERMKVGQGNSENTGRKYFHQLLSGIEYCHARGVCHRDLKPENLLLSDSSDNAILKMADFGLSAVIFAAAAATEGPQSEISATNNEKESLPKDCNLSLEDLPVGSPVKRLTSVVGSPHYVAPEVTDINASGYDGRKVDMWSAGVILYGILTGTLPFGRELTSCPRFKRFKTWITTDYIAAISAGKEPLFPVWLFPTHISSAAKSLIVQLLHPDPNLRISASDALKHRWFTSNSNRQSNISSVTNHPTYNSSTSSEDNYNNSSPISRQSSPNSIKFSKPPIPPTRHNSPTQETIHNNFNNNNNFNQNNNFNNNQINNSNNNNNNNINYYNNYNNNQITGIVIPQFSHESISRSNIIDPLNNLQQSQSLSQNDIFQNQLLKTPTPPLPPTTISTITTSLLLTPKPTHYESALNERESFEISEFHDLDEITRIHSCDEDDEDEDEDEDHEHHHNHHYEHNQINLEDKTYQNNQIIPFNKLKIKEDNNKRNDDYDDYDGGYYYYYYY
mmetsp:Transcript_23150/g.23801  ORF Transcript_23150/g.23801 Transcript_23150/m.23801 type:complete len:739 (-) Transcript_23150:467-2683(-)